MAKEGPIKLTKTVVEALEPLPGKDVWQWDGFLQGFGVRVRPSGRRSYVIQYRDEDGRTRRVSLGAHGSPWTADLARKKAQQMLLAARTGGNPAAELDERRRNPTVAMVCQRYLDEYACVRKKPRSVAEDRRIIDRKIIPNIGALKIASLTRRDVLELQSRLGAIKVQTNRALAVLSKVCSQAEKWELRPSSSNPCRGVERAPEKKRNRQLTADEPACLGYGLSEHEKESPEAVRLFRLLIFTGCRLREIMEADWKDFNLATGVFHLPDSKSGARDVVLNEAAVAELTKVPEDKRKGPVIRGGRRGRRSSAMFNPYKAWSNVCKEGKLEDLRIHDLRHVFASTGVAAGDGLPIIASLLGQAQLSTTERYSHVPTDPVKQASERIGKQLAADLAKVPEHEKKRREKEQAAASNVVSIRRAAE